jgi:hypothetical protein
MDILGRFYADKATKKEVQDYILAFLGEYAKDKVLTRCDVSGIADAKDIIDKAFENLDIIYAIPKRTEDTPNQSR